MRASFRDRPPWLVRVGEVGAGVLVAPDLVLTCAHVAVADRLPVVLVHHGWSGAATVVLRVPIAEDESGDLAVLRLDAPVHDVVVAPLRAPVALADHPYVVQGFARGRHTEARGRLGGRVGPGWVQLDGGPGHVVDRGFSGAPVWDTAVEAVVGIVVMAEKSVRGGALIPVEEVVRLWPGAAALTGWRLDLDDAFDTHWLPRARGVEPHERDERDEPRKPHERDERYEPHERDERDERDERRKPTDVWHFVGRHRALGDLAGYLRGPGDGRVRAVIGTPGSGKSAVLARTVVLADRVTRSRVPADSLSDDVPLPPVGSVTVAVHARGRTLSQVVRAIADAAEVEAADAAELVRRCGPVSVVVDALDEASGDAPVAIATMLSRLAADPARHVVVGTRVGARGSSANLLLNRLGDAVVLDLDSPDYLDHADVLHYVERRVGPGPAAVRIAEQAGGNFLIAQLIALSGGAGIATTVGAAVDEYLSVRFRDPRKARELLLPLAFAEGDGFPEGPLWLDLANALSAAAHTPGDLREVLTSAAGYLVERSGRRYRLFHQALDDAFRAEHPGPTPERVVYETLRRHDTEYVRTNLPAHAVAAGRLDELVEDVDFMLTVSPECVVHLLPHVTSERARAVRHVYRRAAHGLDTGHRAAYFALVARQSGFDALADEVTGPVPWRAEVVAWTPDSEQLVIAQLPTAHHVGLWFDPRGNPAAFSARDGEVTLHRFQDYRLVPEATLPDVGAADGGAAGVGAAGVGAAGVGAAVEAFCVEVTPDGRELGLTVHEDGGVRRWSFTHGLEHTGTARLDGPFESEVVLADSTRTPDGRLLAALVDDGGLVVVDWTDEPEVVCRSTEYPGVVAITAHAGEVLVAHASIGEISLFALRGRRLERIGAPLAGWPNVLRFTHTDDGTCLLLIGGEDALRRTEVRAGGLVETATTRPGAVRAMATTTLTDGRTVAAIAVDDDALDVVDVTHGLVPAGERRSAHGSFGWQVCVGTGPWGTPLVLTSAADDQVRLWELDHVPAAVREPWPTGLRPERVARFGDSGVVLAELDRVWTVTDRLDLLDRVWTVTDRLDRPDRPDRLGGRGEGMEGLGGLEGPLVQITLGCDEPVAVVAGGGGRFAVVGLGPSGLTPKWHTTVPGLRMPFNAVAVSGERLLGVVSHGGELVWVRPDGIESGGSARNATGLLPYRLAGQARFLLVGRRPAIRRPGAEPVELGIRLRVPAADVGVAWGVPVAGVPVAGVPVGGVPVGEVPVGGGVPVAALADGEAVHLWSLADDAPRAWAEPVAVDGRRGSVVAVGFPRADLALLAVAAYGQPVQVWACPRGGRAHGGRARAVAAIDVGSLVEHLVWTADHRLVVVCRAGVLRLSGFG